MRSADSAARGIPVQSWAVAVSADGRRVVLASAERGVRVWDSEDGNCIQSLDRDRVSADAFSVEETGLWMLAGGADGLLRLWDLGAGCLAMTYPGHTDRVTSVSLCPSGLWALSGSCDETLRLWRTRQGECTRVLRGHSGPVTCVHLSDDEARALSAGADGTLRLWDLGEGVDVRTFDGPTNGISAVCLAAERAFAISDGVPHVWDAETGAYLGSLAAPKDRANAIAVTADGRRALVGGDGPALRLWDVEKLECVAVLDGHGDRVVAIHLARDGSRAASASADGEVRVWDMAALACVQILREGGREGTEPAGIILEEASEDLVLDEESTDTVGVGPERGGATSRQGAAERFPAPEPYLDENVQFTVCRPRVVQPLKWCPLLAFAHLSERPPDAPESEPDPIEEVRRQAAQVLGEQAEAYQEVTQDSRQAVPRKGELTFVPDIPGFDVNPPRRTFLWLESVHREEFRIRASPDLDGTTARGRVSVFLGSILLAEVSLSIRVDGAAQSAARGEGPEAISARPFRSIFASYSHHDAAIVEQFEAFARTLGDRYLRDCVSLRAGELWSDRLEQLIEEADVFQLFWSSSSMRSPFVRQEWEYALSLSRPHFIRPTYWEEPLPEWPERNLPSQELCRLHFQRITPGWSPHQPVPAETPAGDLLPPLDLGEPETDEGPGEEDDVPTMVLGLDDYDDTEADTDEGAPEAACASEDILMSEALESGPVAMSSDDWPPPRRRTSWKTILLIALAVPALLAAALLLLYFAIQWLVHGGGR